MKNQRKNGSMLKYGGYASVMTAVVVVLAIIANMVIGQFDLKFDLTKNKLYTLSEDTVSLLKGLNTDITLYSVYAEGSEISVVTEILDKYASQTKRITAENIDPYKNPQFSAKYAKDGEAIAIGSVVVDAGSAYKIITQADLADVVTNQTTGESYMQGIKLEGVLTGAIRSLTSGATSAVYAIAGHGETPICDELKKEMEYGGYSVSDLNLIKDGKIPEDCNILVLNAPVEDITSVELSVIRNYLDNGGRLFTTLGITAVQMPNYDSLLANYGVAASGRMVIEGNSDYVYQQNPYYLVPTLSTESDISSKLSENKTSAFMPFAIDVSMLATKRSTVVLEPFMSSSPYAYSKSMAEIGDYAKAETDPEGPFVLGLSVTDVDNSGTAEGVKLVVFGAETVMESGINDVVNGGNFGLIMNSFDWLTDNEGALRSKSLGAEDYLQLTQSKALVIMFISIILIPLAIIIAGLVVVLRRKNK